MRDEAMSKQEAAEIREHYAKLAETFHDFGPSTRCPDCGSDRQVLHWYKLGRQDAAEAIRKEK